MDIISLVIILLILVIVIVVVTRPLFKSSTSDERQDVVAAPTAGKTEYEEILGHIRELDFEYGLGKMSIEDYETLRNELKAQAAALIQPTTPGASEKEEKASS